VTDKYSYLTICEISVPKSGAKLFTLDGIDLFIRPLRSLIYIYEVSTKRLLLCVDENKKNQAIQLIHNRIQEVKDMIDELS